MIRVCRKLATVKDRARLPDAHVITRPTHHESPSNVWLEVDAPFRCQCSLPTASAYALVNHEVRKLHILPLQLSRMLRSTSMAVAALRLIRPVATSAAGPLGASRNRVQALFGHEMTAGYASKASSSGPGELHMQHSRKSLHFPLSGSIQCRKANETLHNSLLWRVSHQRFSQVTIQTQRKQVHSCLFCAAVTVVFGATGGIGAALAQRLHALKSSGASAQAPSAIILSADGEDKLKSLQQQLKGVDVIPADARDPASVRPPAHRHHIHTVNL
jgi:hypothetical protein